ncbi:hypothetical protein quinque_002661 [Culex quinquefasciatus]
MRRRVARSPSPRGGSTRYASPHREEYSRSARDGGSDRYSYKVLCVSALHPKASDEFIKETLYREYKKFGDFSIRISHDLDERVAYVCFRTSEDAKEAKNAKSRIVLYERAALVEPVFESAKPETNRRPSSPQDYDRHYYARSPGVPPPDRRRPEHHPYDSYGGPPPGRMHHADFRPPMHHEYMPRGPPMHHHGPPHMHPGPAHHHYMARPYMPRPRAPFEKPDNSKKDKFPNYLHHVQPEEDPLATRTLFAGNLEINISDDELRRIFGKYGIVEDIDIKRPPPGTGNAFAFVRYQTLDMAHRAKVELSGQYIGKFQCKIGYGKATPTTRIWVGGLGAWTSVTQLEREFDRFGAIKKIEYNKGDTQAYILYDSIDAATAAILPTTAPHRHSPSEAEVSKMAVNIAVDQTTSIRKVAVLHLMMMLLATVDTVDGRSVAGEVSVVVVVDSEASIAMDHHTVKAETNGAGALLTVTTTHAVVPVPANPVLIDLDHARHVAAVRQIPTRTRHRVEMGALILKSSLFPAKFHLTDGDNDIVESLMKDEDGKHHLRITQRLRLDQPKLEDVQKRISTSSSHAIFLGLPGSTSSVASSDDASVQTRPLRNLVSYLKQKEAAGVISLLNKETEATGVLYSFPPCDFSTELLKRTCHNLTEEGLKEDHLVIVVVKGGTA